MWQNKDRKSRRAWQSLALDYNFLYICKQLNFDLPWVWFIKVLRMSFNLFVPFCLTGTNRGLFYQQTALCHEYIAGTERDLYLKLTRSSLLPNNKQYSIHVTCSLSLLT